MGLKLSVLPFSPPQLEDRLKQMFSVHRMTAWISVWHTSDSSISNKCIHFYFNLLSWQLRDKISPVGISAHRAEGKPTFWRQDWISELLPEKGEPLPNDMISLNPAPALHEVERTRVFHSVVMTGLFADERKQRPVKPATHRPVWVIWSWETEWRRCTRGRRTDE